MKKKKKKCSKMRVITINEIASTSRIILHRAAAVNRFVFVSFPDFSMNLIFI